MSEVESSKPLTEAEKKAKRAERFGVPVVMSDVDKKAKRAERFPEAKEAAKKQKTSEKGGMAKPALTEEEIEKLKKRGERFGETVSKTLLTAEMKAKKEKEAAEKKAQREAEAAEKKALKEKDDAELAEKKRIRAERFGLPEPVSKPATASASASSVPAAPVDPELAAKMEARAARFAQANGAAAASE